MRLFTGIPEGEKLSRLIFENGKLSFNASRTAIPLFHLKTRRVSSRKKGTL